MPKTPETVLEIDLNALAHNYGLLRSRLPPTTGLMGVVKAFAYGSESVAVARKLEQLGAAYLAVAFTAEGVALRKGGVTCPILVLHPQPSGLEELMEFRLEPNLYSPRLLRLFAETAERAGQKDYPVHLEFNTGLNRVGFWENDLDWILQQLSGRNALKIESVFSHLAASDDPAQDAFTRRQIDWFAELATRADAALPGKPFKHLLNTSGVFNYPEAHWDMVRTGIGLYGYSNDPETDPLLRPVATLKTCISQIHRIEPGEWVGYNKGYVAPDYRVTATLPIGHADGIGRLYGKGKGEIFIAGKAAPIIGNVCMDMTMVDITGIACREGDEAILFGKGHSAENLAGRAGTISYELLAGISQRVPRIIVG